MPQHPEGTIEMNNLLVQFTKDCDCTVEDEDDCLILVSVEEVCNTGGPVCPHCSARYSWDNRAIITKMV